MSGEEVLPQGALVGEYVVLRLLGEGTFGHVYEAKHPIIAKPVAIKVLNRRYALDEDVQRRFLAEARAVNLIRHPNIIDIFSFGRLEDGRPYLIMELLIGETLSERLERGGPIGLGQALPILHDVAVALSAAHYQGIAHRDIKPENIFLPKASAPGAYAGRIPVAKLLDFGVAKLMGSKAALAHRTATGVPIGTPLYMSPEQCTGGDVDHRADIYAFGVVTFEVLTGRPPFDKASTLHVLMDHLQTPVPSACALRRELPRAIDVAIANLMAKEADARPASMQAAYESLAQAALSVPADATARGLGQVVVGGAHDIAAESTAFEEARQLVEESVRAHGHHLALASTKWDDAVAQTRRADIPAESTEIDSNQPTPRRPGAGPTVVSPGQAPPTAVSPSRAQPTVVSPGQAQTGPRLIPATVVSAATPAEGAAAHAQAPLPPLEASPSLPTQVSAGPVSEGSAPTVAIRARLGQPDPAVPARTGPSTLGAVASEKPRPPSRRVGLVLSVAAVVGIGAIGAAVYVSRQTGESIPAATGETSTDDNRSAPSTTTASEDADDGADDLADPVVQQVVLTLDVQPVGIDVFHGDDPVPVTDGKISLRRSDEPLTLTLRHSGYQPHEVEVRPDRDQVLRAVLTQDGPPTTPGTAAPAKGPASTPKPPPSPDPPPVTKPPPPPSLDDMLEDR